MILREFRDFSAKNKDKAWFARILQNIIVNKNWLVAKDRHDRNRTFSEACYDVSKTKSKYDTFSTSPDAMYIDFSPIDLFGSRKTSIISILEKQGFEVRARCTDPTASSKREQDIALLKAEKELEPIRKQFASALGMQKPLPISKPEDFSSDISPISKMGLDISNPIDEGIYKEYLQRQIWEIACELGITHYLNLNEGTELFKKWAGDIIDDNCLAGQVQTDNFSCEPFLEHLNPFEVYTILGQMPDGRDAIAKGWEKLVSVKQVIQYMGNEIDDTKLNELLQLANTATGTQFGGIYFPEMGGSCPKGWCTYAEFINLKCGLGYLEFVSQNSDLYIHRKEGANILTEKSDLAYETDDNITIVESITDLQKPKDRALEYRFYNVTYKGYYIPFSNFVFNFGKLPLALRYGSKNQYTDFSIVTYKQQGKSMNEKCQPFILHIFDLWAKIQHFINQSRPSGELWNIETVRLMAQEIIGLQGEQGKVMDMLKILTNTVNGVYVPETIEGQATGGDSMPVKWQTRGLDPTVVQLWDMIQRDKQQIIDITGVNDVLLATSQPSGDQGLGVSRLALQQSINTIYYIQSALTRTFSNASLNICQKIQWIASGKKTDEAYISLVKAIGQRNVDAITALGKEPPYQYSLFIDFGMNELQREEIHAITLQMLQTKQITAAQAFQINDIKNYKLAGALLALYEAKNTQMMQQNQSQAAQIAMAAEDQKSKNKVNELNVEGQWKNQVATTQGEYSVKVEMLKIQGKSTLEDQKSESKAIHSDISHSQDLQKMVAEKQLEQD